MRPTKVADPAQRILRIRKHPIHSLHILTTRTALLFKSYPGLHALSNPPQHAPPHAPYHTAALAWQWGGTKLPCSAVLVLLVGCLLPGGGALSTSPAAPTTAASLEGSSGSTSASPSPGRGLSDSMTNRKWLQ